MYSVKAIVDSSNNSQEILIHDNKSPLKELHLIDPKLKMADTSAGTFSAALTPYNPGYSLIEKMNSTIKVYKENNLIWTGRIISESIDFWNRRTISCEGALAFLNDTIQPIEYYGTGSTPYSILGTLLEIHNSKVSSNRKLYLGSVDNFEEYEYGSYIFQTDNGTTWEELKFNILDRFDCHLAIRYSNNKPYIDLYSDYPNTATQQINFGYNLLDFTRDWNLINMATVIYPRGSELEADTEDGQKDYITLKSSNEESIAIEDGQYSLYNVSGALTVEGKYIINNSLYSQYGRIEQVVDFNDATNATDLFFMAKYYIASSQFDDITLKVKAVDIHAMTDSEASFELLDEVYCLSIPHGLYGGYFPIIEVDIPLDKPENTSYTMSRSSTNNGFTGSFNTFKSNINSSFRNIASTGHILNLAKIEASSIINRKTTGYVSVVDMREGEDGTAQAIVISNNPEWKRASKYWIWNMNGLAYYSATRSQQIAEAVGTSQAYPYSEMDNYNFQTSRYYDMAITMDGTIVANHIKTGILSDSMGYNYWNLETGDFSLQPNTRMYYGGGSNDYKSIFDMIYNTDKALNKREGSANHLNGTKTWAKWHISGLWSSPQGEEITCSEDNSNPLILNRNVLINPDRQLQYIKVKGYTMTFSIEGVSYDSWGEIANDNAFVVSIGLYSSTGQFFGSYYEKAFVFTTDYTRRYTTFDMINSNFGLDNYVNSYDEAYIEIRLINNSRHQVTIRRAQFERGNTPTDWAISDADADAEALNKATTAYNASITAAASMDSAVQSNAITEATRLSQKALSDSKTFASNISKNDREYSDNIVDAFNKSLNQRDVLKRLTNNFSTSIIYQKDGELMINADYIRSGSLEAGILTAGVIHDIQDKCKWNLTNGYFETRNAVFINSEVQGQFVCGRNSGSKIVLEDGAIKFYWDNQYTGSLSAHRYWNAGRNRYEYGVELESHQIYLNADDQIMLSAPSVIENKDADYDEERYDIYYVEDVVPDGDSIVPVVRGIHFIWLTDGRVLGLNVD